MVKSSWAARKLLMLDSFVNKLCSLGSSSMFSKMSKLELARASSSINGARYPSLRLPGQYANWKKRRGYYCGKYGNCNLLFVLFLLFQVLELGSSKSISAFCIGRVWQPWGDCRGNKTRSYSSLYDRLVWMTIVPSQLVDLNLNSKHVQKNS